MNPLRSVAIRLGYWQRRARLGRPAANVIQRYLGSVVAPVEPADEGRIRFLGLEVDPGRHAFLVEGMPFLARLQAAGGQLRMVDGEFEVAFGDVRVRPISVMELLVVNEIFAEDIYAIEDAPEEAVVWDIGLNIGVAALFFATRYGYRVVGHELVPDTAQAALTHVRLSGLVERIEVHPVGLGSAEGTFRIPANTAYRACNSLGGNVAFDKKGPETEVEVRVVDAAEAAERVFAEAGETPVILKIDCEGAEYAILARLEEAGFLGRFERILMEVHDFGGRDPEEVLDRMRRAGYKVEWPGRTEQGVGMVRARRP